MELAEKIAELNRTISQLETSNETLIGLQSTLDNEHLTSQRLEKELSNQVWQTVKQLSDLQEMTNINRNSELTISALTDHVSNLSDQLGVEILNNKNLEFESQSIKSSRGYRLISVFWKIKGR